MLETAAALVIVKPLAKIVLSAIVGVAASDLYKKIWYRPRKGVDELEVALLKSAFQAVIDCYTQALNEKASSLSRKQQKAIKARISKFRTIAKRAHKLPEEYVADLVRLSDAVPLPGTSRPLTRFGPLVVHAREDMPEAVQRAFDDHFADALQNRFDAQLRDDKRVFHLFMAEAATDIRAAQAELPSRVADELFERLKHNEAYALCFAARASTMQLPPHTLTDERCRLLWNVFQAWSNDRRALPDGLDDLDQVLRLPHDDPAQEDRKPNSGDLLKSYPEPQTHWVGRVVERGQLSAAWLPVRKQIYTIVGFGGQGKSALARRFTETLRRLENPDDRPLVVWWSFYLNRSADEFFDQAARPLNIRLRDEESNTRRNSEQIARDMIDRMRTGVDGRRVLLVLDGLEVIQETTKGREGRIKDVALYGLLKGILDDNQPDTPAPGMVLITTREPLTDLTRDKDRPFTSVDLDQLSGTDGADLLINLYGLKINHDEAEAFVKEVVGHALTLTLTGTLLRKSGATSATLLELREFIASEEARVTDREVTTRSHRLPGYVLRHCAGALDDEHRQIMRLLSCCVRPATKRDIEEVFLQPIGDTDEEKRANDKLLGRKYAQLRNGPILHLCELHLIEGDEDAGYDMHPLIRRHFYEEETGEGKLTRVQRRAVHARFFEVLPKRQSKHHPDTMGEMEPLIDAVLHGCRADLADRAFKDVFYTRIDRKDTGQSTAYLSAGLGASETHLQLLRAFFLDGDFDGKPRVSVDASKAYLIGGAGVVLMNTGRPGDAVPLFERAAEMRRRQSTWTNRSAVFQNLSGALGRLGRLPDAFEAARNALTDLEKVSASHSMQTRYTLFSHANAADVAAQRGMDAAGEHFGKAIDLESNDWLKSLRGGWHCTWLTRSRDFERARTAGEKNAAWCAERAGLHEQTFAFATQALVERLAWAAGDSGRKTLDEMQAFADESVKIGKRSGHHYYFTCALLEAGRCAAARAGYEPDRRKEYVADAERYLAEAESRADYAASREYPGGYRIIQADIHVTRAQLAKLAGDKQAMHDQCEAAIAICDDPTCDYAWAKEDALALIGSSRKDR